MTFLEQVRRKLEGQPKVCRTCGNLICIAGRVLGCKACDKLILPDYPPYHDDGPHSPECPDWTP